MSGNAITKTRTIMAVPILDTSTGASFTGTNVYLSGATSTGAIFSSIMRDINLITTGVTLRLPTSNLVITSSGTWDGILHGASLIATG